MANQQVEEAKLLLEYIKDHPRMGFSNLATLVKQEQPQFKDHDDSELILRLARLAYNYWSR